ncbi:hypothetical protein Cgig2_012005 [Carnegiea gigantea]|uniref:Uncharacterized protein n=1 Tax=Carnegiea gigantea TaxID=171969 RepID=A0A9Q1QPR8_9CARY|nr:hypothetical protein Cgig2_012005 [Carnegiea gigantea]
MWKTAHGRHTSSGLRKLGPLSRMTLWTLTINEQVLKLGRRFWKTIFFVCIKCDCRGGGAPSFAFQYRSLFSVPSIAFPHFLSTREMAEYFVHHFEWERCGVAFSPSPLPKDFQAPCPSYELVMAKEAVGRFELPELPQVIFYAMLLNEVGGRTWANALGIGVGPHQAPLEYLRVMGAAPSSGQRLNQRRRARGPGNRRRTRRPSRRMRARPSRGRPPFLTMISRRRSGVTGEKRDKESLRWRRAARSPHPLPEDYFNLCPPFSLPEAERAALDFELPEMVRATFYAMLLNDAVELGVA